MNRVQYDPSTRQEGFSLVELMLALVITLVICGLAFGLLASTLRQKTRSNTETEILADANQALGLMTTDIMNSGFGLSTNGLKAADCIEDKIRVRANLNALLGEPTSNVVTDRDEDVIYQLAAKPGGGKALVRSDVGLGASTVIVTEVDDSDVDNDGDGDGLTFSYLDAAGVEVTPPDAVSVTASVRFVLPAMGVPGGDGYQPRRTKLVSIPIVLRNGRLAAY